MPSPSCPSSVIDPSHPQSANPHDNLLLGGVAEPDSEEEEEEEEEEGEEEEYAARFHESRFHRLLLAALHMANVEDETLVWLFEPHDHRG
ncbi:hypothetical protein NQZ68_025929 [Dissostichus eleginoides]|nr:hypothetical protein NQZ68_025929 [Dissostichus eleginoides]